MALTWRIRLRATALLGALALVGAAFVAAPPATATHAVDQSDTDNCAAPTAADCPPGSDNFVDTDEHPDVTQTSSGGTNYYQCVALDCQISQTNTTGPNVVVTNQSDTDVSNLTTAPLSPVNQSSLLTLDATQTNGSGTNSIAADQGTALTATANVNLPVENNQTARQVVIVSQTSDSGDQTFDVGQDMDLTSDILSSEATQRQNAVDDEGDVPDQHIQASIISETGVNTVIHTQSQTFVQSAAGPLGNEIGFSGADQQQGAPNDTAALFCAATPCGSDVDSGTFSKVTSSQSKEWTQTAPGAANTQAQWDELSSLLGKLSPHLKKTTQEAKLQNNGFQRCVQLMDWTTKIGGVGSQTCNNNGQQNSQALAAKQGTMTQVCNESGECTTQEKSGEGVEVIGDDGCGAGFIKQNKNGSHWNATGLTRQQTVKTFFSGAVAHGFGDDTLQQALDYTNEPSPKALVRQGVAAIWNAFHPDVHYAQFASDVIDAVNDALASGDAAQIASVQQQLDAQNNAGCPLRSNGR